MQERNKLEAAMKAVQEIEEELSENIEVSELAEMEQDEDLFQEALIALQAVQARAGKAELQALLTGEADGNDSYLEIHPGAG